MSEMTAGPTSASVRPMGLFTVYCSPEVRNLIMDKRRLSIMSKSAYTLVDEDGQLLLKWQDLWNKGSSWMDASGRILLHSGYTGDLFSGEVIRFPKSSSNEKRIVGWIRSHAAEMYRVEITFVDQSTGVKKLLHVGGDCRGHATLMVDGRVVGSFISDKQSSAKHIQVAATVDILLVFVAAVRFNQLLARRSPRLKPFDPSISM